MDVKKIFLNGDLDEEIYMEQSPKSQNNNNNNKVSKLVKSLWIEISMRDLT